MGEIEETIIAVHRDLRIRGWRTAVAESLTGGRVQSLLTGVAGASEVFAGGVTTYAVESKVALLGVDRAAAESCDAVSKRVACEMVAGVCSMFDTECGIATTGYAEAADGVSQPFAWLAVSVMGEVIAERFSASGTRLEVQQMFAEKAVGLLQKALSKKESG